MAKETSGDLHLLHIWAIGIMADVEKDVMVGHHRAESRSFRVAPYVLNVEYYRFTWRVIIHDVMGVYVTDVASEDPADIFRCIHDTLRPVRN